MEILANIKIQPVIYEYKAVAYLSQYFSKTEDKCSHTIKEAAKENFKIQHKHKENVLHKKYFTKFCQNREKLKRIFSAVPFVKLNLPDEFKYYFLKKNLTS